MIRPNIHIEPSAYCWRPYWSSRFESLWSLLRKFAYLNATTHGEIRRIFGGNGLSLKPDPTRWCLRSDLRHFGALDPSKLAIIFGLNYKDLAEGTVLRFVHEHEAGILTSEFLRYCPTCIRHGFHSALHQLVFLNKCPAHGDTIESRCVDCLTPTIPYKLPSVTSKDISKCSHMLYGLSHHLIQSDVNMLRKEAADREKALLSDAEWLMKRVEENPPEQPLTQWVPQAAGRKCVTRYIKRLPVYWADVFRSNSHEGSFNISDVKGTHIQALSHRYSNSKISNRYDATSRVPETEVVTLDLYLYRIYKALRRYLTRRYFWHHRRCIAEVGRHVWWDKQTLTHQGAICPSANALLLWRMFWEDVNHPDKLFKPLGPHRPWFEDTHQRINWDAPYVALPDWAIQRIFTIDCVGIFHECFLLAEALYRRKAYSFQLGYVRGRRRAHWLIEKSASGELTVHWWVSRSLTSFFAQISSQFKSCKKPYLGEHPMPHSWLRPS